MDYYTKWQHRKDKKKVVNGRKERIGPSLVVSGHECIARANIYAMNVRIRVMEHQRIVTVYSLLVTFGQDS